MFVEVFAGGVNGPVAAAGGDFVAADDVVCLVVVEVVARGVLLP